MAVSSEFWKIELLVLSIVALAFLYRWLTWPRRGIKLERFDKNPILTPIAAHWWESEAVFNPAAFVDEGRVHLFYRALGTDGISRIGYASSIDGINFERLPYPVYDQGANFNTINIPNKYRPLSYDTDSYASGGGWGGCEDPRVVKIDDRAYLSFSIFEGWQSIRLGVTSISMYDLNSFNWKWSPYVPLSPQGETNKNWVLFPGKIKKKFAILHALTPKVMIEYVDSIESVRNKPIKSDNHRSGREGKWDAFVRGAGAPPIKTKYGWLLLYHGMNPRDGIGYKVGAMLLDLKNPAKILYRSESPILEPDMWYENDWKPGVVYASGAVVLGDDLIVYYGGGDKYVAAAKLNLEEFLRKLLKQKVAKIK